MRLGEHALPRCRGRHRDTKQLCQLTQLCLRVAHAHTVPRNDHGLLCLVKQLQGLGDALGAGGWPLVGEVRFGVVQPWCGVGPHGLGEGSAVVEHGYRAWMTRQSMLDGKLRVLYRGGRLTALPHGTPGGMSAGGFVAAALAALAVATEE